MINKDNRIYNRGKLIVNMGDRYYTVEVKT